MKKFLFSTALITLLSLYISSSVFAETVKPKGTLLPSNENVDKLSESECVEMIEMVEYGEYGDQTLEEFVSTSSEEYVVGWLGCAIKSGYIKFWMVPYFIKYILNWLIGLSGLIAVLMIIIGGYYYILGGVNDDKEKGKKIIQYALGGMVLATLSWIIVNIILLGITS